MQWPKPSTLVIVISLLSRFMQAMALGVLSAGLLLVYDRQIELSFLITTQQSWLARLLFLLWVGISFGIGGAVAKGVEF